MDGLLKCDSKYAAGPVALVLGFLLCGTPSAPAVNYVPTLGDVFAAGGCGFTFQGCGLDIEGNPCGTPNGRDCFFDYDASMADLNPAGHPLHYYPIDWRDAASGQASEPSFIQQVLDGLTTVTADRAQEVAKEVCRYTGAASVSFQIQGSVSTGAVGGGASITVTYNCADL